MTSRPERAAVATPDRRAVLLLLALAGCTQNPGDRVTLAVEGKTVVLEGTRSLRALQFDLAWDEGVTVEGIAIGADAARLNLFRARIADDGRGARVVLADTRKLKLPMRGIVALIDAEGSGAIRVTGALGAADGAEAVEVEVAQP